jgi:hypothetical protein
MPIRYHAPLKSASGIYGVNSGVKVERLALRGALGRSATRPTKSGNYAFPKLIYWHNRQRPTPETFRHRRRVPDVGFQKDYLNEF